MSKNRVLITLSLATLPLCAHAHWFRDEEPPANAKPLSEVIKAVEAQGEGRITEVEFDDGMWEIEVHRPDGKEANLKVDAVSGQIQPTQ